MEFNIPSVEIMYDICNYASKQNRIPSSSQSERNDNVIKQVLSSRKSQ